MGFKHDHLLDEHPELKTARVYDNIEDIPEDMYIDIDDWYAQNNYGSFALLENLANKKQGENMDIVAHNKHVDRLRANKK